MKRLLLAGLAFVAVAGPAAADLARPIKRRPVVVAPVYGWTGVYVGGNLGYSWGNARTDIAGNATFVAMPTFFGGIPDNRVAFANSNTARLKGVIGGGQIGYNYQFSPRWVLGFEADIQASGERGSNTFADPFSTIFCIGQGFNGQRVFCFDPVTGLRPLNGVAATAYDAKISWFGTNRGRLGALISDHVLVYGTGGLAYGRIELSGITNVSGSYDIVSTAGGGNFFGIVPFTPGANAFSKSKIKVGYTVGGGIEGKFSYWAGWTWKLEYLYVDLGSLDTVGPFPGGSAPIRPPFGGLWASPFTGVIATHTRFTDNILRVGLNYKFDYAIPGVYR